MHTKEPWSVYAAGDIICVEPRKQATGYRPNIVDWTGFDSNEMPHTKSLANARRIVDCVNALAGLNPSALAGLIEAAERLNSVLKDAPMTGHISEPTARLIEARMAGLDTALANLRGDA